MSASTIDQILKSNKVIICAGSGGVGKTTIAASLALRAAEIGINTLVLTVDPAKRLATALGLDLNDDNKKRVPLKDSKGELFAAVIDSRKTFDQFIAANAGDSSAVKRIMNNRLYKQLSTTLAGSQEFTSLERLLQEVESGKYRLVVLDTPPTKHAMDFLRAPQRIHSLFQDSMTSWFMSAAGTGGGILSSLMNKGARTILRSLETLTGGQFIEELVDFFAAINVVQKKIRDRSIAVQKLLSDAKTRFVVVTSFDSAKLEEARYLQTELRRMGFTLSAVIVNRAFPMWLPENFKMDSVPQELEATYEKVLKCHEEFKRVHAFRYNLYEEFAQSLKNGPALFRIPEFDQDIFGIEDLSNLAKRLSEGEE